MNELTQDELEKILTFKINIGWKRVSSKQEKLHE